MADTNNISNKAVELIVRFETGGKEYYNSRLARPSWPGGASGVTIGCGVDLGYDASILDDPEFQALVTEDQMNRLRSVVKLKGASARAAVSRVRDVVVPWDFALEYFERETLPKYVNQTLQAFPNSEQLPDDAFGALVSIVFNRGPLVDNSDRRREMKAIRDILLRGRDKLVDKQDILDIARQVRSMARLWPNNTKSNNDLNDRRHREADLIEGSV